jgi:transglutaminase-like putative cysteine protease
MDAVGDWLAPSLAAVIATALASMGMGTLFSGWAWLVPTLSCIGCAALGAVASRAVRLPAWMAAPTAFLALLLGLTIGYSEGHAILGFIPSPGAIEALRGQLESGASYLATSEIPMWPHHGAVTIVAAGAGLAGIAVDACAVTLRRAAVAGYPLLIVTAIPMIARRDDMPWWSFVCTAVGYVLLLAVAQLNLHSDWGRVLRQRATRAHQGLTQPAQLVGVLAIVLAVGITGLLPGSSGHGLFSGLSGLKRLTSVDNRSAETVHPFTSLRGELNQPTPTELLRVRTNDPDPFYLRLTSLDRFTGDGWTQNRLHAGDKDRVSNWDPRPLPLRSQIPHVTQRTRIDVVGLSDSSYLPVYANPTQISTPGDWRWDSGTETVFSARQRTDQMSYEFTSVRVPYDRALLAAAPPVSRSGSFYRRYTALDGPVRSEVGGLVDSLMGKGRSELDIVLAALEHFDESNGFKYTERTKPGSSGDALVDFLNNKEGFCEQYASAMAYLVRAAHIPARVAVGFSRGHLERGDSGDFVSITTRDAHAWVEVYFNGIGWVPFDPTPPAGPGRSNAGDDAPQPSPSTESTTAPTSRVPSQGPSAPAVAPSRPLGSHAAGNSGNGDGGWPLWLAIVALAVAVPLLIGPGIYRGRSRGDRLRRLGRVGTIPDASGLHGTAWASGQVRGRGAAYAAWDELTDTAFDLGALPRDWTRPPVTWRRAYTPRELIDALRTDQLTPIAREAVEHICRVHERARYGRTVGATAGLADAVTAACAGLRDRAPRGRVILARLWPPSVAERARFVTRRRLGQAQQKLLRVWSNADAYLRRRLAR